MKLTDNQKLLLSWCVLHKDLRVFELHYNKDITAAECEPFVGTNPVAFRIFVGWGYLHLAFDKDDNIIMYEYEMRSSNPIPGQRVTFINRYFKKYRIKRGTAPIVTLAKECRLTAQQFIDTMDSINPAYYRNGTSKYNSFHRAGGMY